MRKLFMAAAALSLTAGMANAQVTLDDFTTVTAVNHPEGAGVYGTIYDVKNDAFSTATAGSGTLIFGDGGFSNGLYVIYEAAVPNTGDYTVSIDLVSFTETTIDAIDEIQIGVKVNGVHRAVNPSLLAAADDAVANFSSFLTIDDTDNSFASPSVTITTPTFSATAGDDLLIAISTNVSDYATDSGSWGAGAQIELDNLILTEEVVSSVADWTILAD